MLRQIKNKVFQCLRGKKGQGLTEYAVILGIVVLIGTAIAGSDSFQTKVINLYDNVGTSLGNLGHSVSSAEWATNK